MNERSDDGRLVVVSNRLPVVVRRDEQSGIWTSKPATGGLVTALSPVLRERGGIWIGWPGTGEVGALEAILASDQLGFTLHPIALTQQEVDGYYYGFANEVVWPLFHDLLARCNFDPSYWPAYEQVNAKFAHEVAEQTRAEDFLWIHDYHLLLCAAKLREQGSRHKVGFFLHIPFPPLDLFVKLPWRSELLQGLLQYDLLAFQTRRDRRNFVQCVRALSRGVKLVDSRKPVAKLVSPVRTIRIAALPIGIDFKSFAQQAGGDAVAEQAWYIHERLPRRQLILGVDRLDYTKGIPERIRALGNALERYPELRGKITFIQVVVPSRVDVPAYRELKAEIERLVGEINGRFTVSGWTPIHYIYRALEYTELLAYYRTCEIALITPLKDGMNLVAKEYCACSLDTGVLVLSEFAGAAAQLHDAALLVNPFDIEAVADAIYRACTMEPQERRRRMRKMRRNVQSHDVFRWVDAFLEAAAKGRATPQSEAEDRAASSNDDTSSNVPAASAREHLRGRR